MDAVFLYIFAPKIVQNWDDVLFCSGTPSVLFEKLTSLIKAILFKMLSFIIKCTYPPSFPWLLIIGIVKIFFVVFNNVFLSKGSSLLNWRWLTSLLMAQERNLQLMIVFIIRSSLMTISITRLEISVIFFIWISVYRT